MIKYYVSTNGNNSNDGSEGKPLKEISLALNRLKNKMLENKEKTGYILLFPGVYQEDIELFSGVRLYRYDEKFYVTVSPYEGGYNTRNDEVIIKRKLNDKTVLSVRNATDVIIQGITIHGDDRPQRGIFIEGADNITVSGCKITNCKTRVIYDPRYKEKGTKQDPYLGESRVLDGGSGAGIYIKGSSNVEIFSNWIGNNYTDLKYTLKVPVDIKDLDKVDWPILGPDPDALVIKVKRFYKKDILKILIEQAEYYRNGGGGIYSLDSSQVTIKYNYIISNKAVRGGGIRFGNKAYGKIEGNIIINNHAFVDGGGIAIWDYDRSNVSRNQKISIVHNKIKANTSDDDGAGIYLTAKTIAELTDNLISDNVSQRNGGGLRITFGSEIIVRNTVFRNNIANADAGTYMKSNKDGGGAIAVRNSALRLENCQFENNKVMGFAGGAVYFITAEPDKKIEELGKKMYGEGFTDILKKKYKFSVANLQISNCIFKGNECSGETCYDDECDPKSRKGFKNGSAGGALYMLEKKGYLPTEISIKDSTFENNYSEYREPEQRADLVLIDCESVSMANETISKHPKNKYKMYVSGCKLKDISNSKCLKCENKNAKMKDNEVFVSQSFCSP